MNTEKIMAYHLIPALEFGSQHDSLFEGISDSQYESLFGDITGQSRLAEGQEALDEALGYVNEEIRNEPNEILDEVPSRPPPVPKKGKKRKAQHTINFGRFLAEENFDEFQELVRSAERDESNRIGQGEPESNFTWERYMSKEAKSVFSRLYELRNSSLPYTVDELRQDSGYLRHNYDWFFIDEYHRNNDNSALLDEYVERSYFLLDVGENLINDRLNKIIVLGKEETSLIEYCEYFLKAKEAMSANKFIDFVGISPKHVYFNLALQLERPGTRYGDFASTFLLYGDFSVFPPERYWKAKSSSKKFFLQLIESFFITLHDRNRGKYNEFKNLFSREVILSSFNPNDSKLSSYREILHAAFNPNDSKLSSYMEILQLFNYHLDRVGNVSYGKAPSRYVECVRRAYVSPKIKPVKGNGETYSNFQAYYRGNFFPYPDKAKAN